jgi:hypothetical protein
LVDTKGKTTGILTKERLESAVLLGTEEKMMHSLAADIQRSASKNGANETISDLQKYLDESEIHPWETTRIQQFIALLKS